MDSNSYKQISNFVDLLNSQQDTVFGYVQDNVEVSSSQIPFFTSRAKEEDSPAERGERMTWTPVDDIALISAWLNTSKDPIVGNEQRAGSEVREASHCKQRWQKINDQVNKFCGSYEAASRERSSGQNETDVLKLAHEIFYNNHKKKFTLEHAWKELRNGQKWCDLSGSKTKGSAKRRNLFDDSAQSSSSHAFEATTGEDKQATIRPAGVKALKGHGKKTMAEGKALNEVQIMWTIKKEDLAVKERLSKMRLLDSLLAKQELAEYEEELKKKFITELLSSYGVKMEASRVEESRSGSSS
ncbi:PREDICTED: glutathione S-transferase T3-like [Brassica oleracea var. oleracea]|uniref:glutathione S-transferase T3-like n=1 Tax=Brassica oleracea var. oleracea TaxID=109376 RepID=UPI0006A6B0AF|nr:PREDICTED: glutathione S-transferase T3-like [Brassica oleracea var. oleracea]